MFDVNNSLHLVAEAMQCGQAEQAVVMADQAIGQYRNDGRLYEIAGLAYCQLGKTQIAIARFESAATIQPLSTISQIRLATCYWRAGHPETAVAMAEFLKQRFIEDHLEMEFATQIVHCCQEFELFSAAAHVCHKVYEFDINNGHAAYGVAWYRAMGGDDIRDSMGWLEMAVRLEPTNARYRITLGHAFADSYDISLAVRIFLGLTPEHVGDIQCRRCLLEMIDYLCLHDSPISQVVQELQHQLQIVSVTNSPSKTGIRHENEQ